MRRKDQKKKSFLKCGFYNGIYEKQKLCEYTCNAYLYKTNKLAYFVMLFLFIFGLCFVHIYLGTFWIFFFNIKQANLKQKNKKCRLRNPTCLIKSYQDLTVINHLMPVCYFKINTNTCALT